SVVGWKKLMPKFPEEIETFESVSVIPEARFWIAVPFDNAVMSTVSNVAETLDDPMNTVTLLGAPVRLTPFTVHDPWTVNWPVNSGFVPAPGVWIVTPPTVNVVIPAPTSVR